MTKQPLTGTFYGSQGLLLQAKNACVRAKDDPQESLAGILLSALALESFLNEFEELAQEHIGPTDPSQLETLRDILSDLENIHAPIGVKIQTIHYILTLKRFNFGSVLYQDLRILLELCDALVHRKNKNASSIPSSTDNQDDPHAIVQYLTNRKVISKPKDSQSWSNDLLSLDVSIWAFKVVVSVIRDIHKKMPESLFKYQIDFLVKGLVSA